MEQELSNAENNRQLLSSVLEKREQYISELEGNALWYVIDIWDSYSIQCSRICRFTTHWMCTPILVPSHFSLIVSSDSSVSISNYWEPGVHLKKRMYFVDGAMHILMLTPHEAFYFSSLGFQDVDFLWKWFTSCQVVNSHYKLFAVDISKLKEKCDGLSKELSDLQVQQAGFQSSQTVTQVNLFAYHAGYRRRISFIAMHE